MSDVVRCVQVWGWRLLLPLLVLAGACQLPPVDEDQAVDAARPPHDGGLPDLIAPRVGTLRIRATDDETGLPLPARVLIRAISPTPQPELDAPYAHPFVPGLFIPGGVGRALAPGVRGSPEGVILEAGDGTFPLPAGSYEVIITHGPEWEWYPVTVAIADKGTVEIRAPLRHSVDTRGWLAADLHIHTARSFDSYLSLEDRVISEVAVGVEVLGATDHNVITDLQPVVEELGYQHLARAVVGDEFNFMEGHGGAYPMPLDGREYRLDKETGGAVKLGLNYDIVKNLTAGVLFDQLHALPTHPVITINHPRLLPDLGYFSNIRWSPPAPMPTAGRFDAMELLNGYMDSSVNGAGGRPSDIPLLLRDWFFLLSSGTRVTALGNSDTHRLADVRAGFPRSWLRVPTDDPSQLGDADFADAIRNGRAIASNGPFATLTVEGKGIGDLASAVGGSVNIDATVDAPGWIDVTHVVLWVDGQKAREFSVVPGARPVFHQTLSLPVSGDAWIALSATGKRPLPHALIGEHQADLVLPFVITNPVFVDGDGDGVWRPHVASPDPGPLGAEGDRWDPSGVIDRSDGERAVEQECEPPLWAVPSTWATPR